MVLIYGFSVLYLIAGILGYTLGSVQVFLIALACYIIDQFTFKSIRRFFTIIGTISGMMAIGVYLLYRYELLDQVWLGFVDFMTVYYYSITVATVSIDLIHQSILLILIGLILMASLDRFIGVNQHNYIYLLSITVLLIIGGFLSRSMGSSRDREAFMILSGTMIIYYFYNIYYKFTDFRRKFLPFITTIIVFILIIVGGSRALYKIDPRPLTQVQERTAFTLSEDVEYEVPVYDKLNYFKSDTIEVADSFEYDYIEIMRIRSEEVRYLKAETYELYYDGAWSKSKELPYLAEDGDAVQRSKAYDSVDYKDYYDIEDVRIVVKNFNTNVLLVNNYGIVDPLFYDNLRVMNDNRRGTYFTNERIADNYVYEFGAIIPNYGGKAFDTLIRSNSNDGLPVELDQYRGPLSARYNVVKELALEVTAGIENKYDQALAIEKYLGENYRYNDTPPVPPDGVEPIIYFLFESQEGFCQQFTTAYILMLRSLDIPARYAVGFYVGDRDDDDDEDYNVVFEEGFIEESVYSVYDYNAHTWPEVYFPEVGWIMFEPTPGRYYKWAEIDYDQYDYELNQDEEEQGGIFQVDFIDFTYLIGILLIGLILLGFVMVLRHRLNLKKQSPSDKMLMVHHLIRAYMKRSGLRKSPFETAREYALKVDEYMFDLNGINLLDLVIDYEGVVYGGLSIERDDLEKHVSYYKKLQKVMARRLMKIQLLRMKVVSFFKLNI